jgi:non-homologous end joining protein Ku
MWQVLFESAFCCVLFLWSLRMAPRANWKGFLRLSLVTCPVALYPATSDSEKISFNQINRNTGHRIKYLKVDADTAEEVSSEDIMKGYKVDTDSYIEVTKDELENIALDSNRTIDIDEFVPKADIDPRYLIRPYYLVPDGKVGHDAFAVIRETIRIMDMVKGENVVKLMDALKRSIANDRGAEPAKGKKPRKAAADQKEMLLPISGKRASKAEAKKDKPAASRARKRA